VHVEVNAGRSVALQESDDGRGIAARCRVDDHNDPAAGCRSVVTAPKLIAHHLGVERLAAAVLPHRHDMLTGHATPPSLSAASAFIMSCKRARAQSRSAP
jgi:hypothetical protein